MAQIVALEGGGALGLGPLFSGSQEKSPKLGISAAYITNGPRLQEPAGLDGELVLLPCSH